MKFDATAEIEREGCIECLKGMYSGAVIDIHTGEDVIVGRSYEGVNLVISSPNISRRHCLIKYIPETEEYAVTDYSRNGTYLKDGRRLIKDKEEHLPRGTILYIANTENVFRLT